MYEDDEDTPSFVELNTGKRLKYDILDSNKVGFIAYRSLINGNSLQFIEFGIFGEGSQISTYQKQESSGLSLTIIPYSI